MTLVSVEQTSYSGFLETLPSSTLIASLAMEPYEGSAVLELNPNLVFVILELLLGGSGKSPSNFRREITEIERNLMEGMLRLVLRNLSEAWKGVTAIDFSVQSLETEPQMLQVMAPSEAVVSIGVEMRIGEVAGLMSIAMPSVMIKMMRHKFDQQWSLRKAAATEEDEERVLNLLGRSSVDVEATIEGGGISLRELMELNVGDVLGLDHALDKPVTCSFNGQKYFAGSILASRRRLAVRIADTLT
jgi:flagellar motor switch protein FliM